MSRGFLELRGQGPAVLAPCPAGLHTGAGVGRRDCGRRQRGGQVVPQLVCLFASPTLISVCLSTLITWPIAELATPHWLAKQNGDLFNWN